jgi:hypothetical protein
MSVCLLLYCISFAHVLLIVCVCVRVCVGVMYIFCPYRGPAKSLTNLCSVPGSLTHGTNTHSLTHTWHLEVRGNAEVAGQASFAKRLITARRETREVRRTLRGVFAEMAVFVLRHIALPRRGTLSSVCMCVCVSVRVYIDIYIKCTCIHRYIYQIMMYTNTH